MDDRYSDDRNSDERYSDERYSRQVLFKEIGAAGQDKLAAARVVIVGCGATGSVLGIVAGAFGGWDAADYSIATMLRPAICSGSRCLMKTMLANLCLRLLRRRGRLHASTHRLWLSLMLLT